MSNAEITSKVEALRELEELIEEAKAEVEAIKDELKAHMIAMNTADTICRFWAFAPQDFCSHGYLLLFSNLSL